jgi:hypothetical protein
LQATMSDGSLPSLPEPSRSQLVLWGVWIAAAALLSAAAGVRLFREVALPQWWTPLAVLAGIAAADFASGLLHWAADTWGRADLPVIGRRILVPFRVHHINPDDFLRRRFLDTNGDVAAISVPLLLGLLAMPLESTWQRTVALSGLAFCVAGGMTNQIHQWAHMPSPPGLVRVLQRLGLFLGPREHAVHHQRPYHGHYCITTGWCNRLLDRIAFFRRLEAAITALTGARPRGDEQMARSGSG